jgi:putative glutamine amidotransferase
MTPPLAPLIAVAGRAIAAGKVVGWRNAAVGVPVGYLEAVNRAGGQEAILCPVQIDDDEAAHRLRRFDGLLLIGGGDVHPSHYGEESEHPALWGLNATSDAFELAMARAAVRTGLPTLAVCRGIQVLNVALGGTLVQHIEPAEEADHGDPGDRVAVHDVRLAPDSRIAAAMGPVAGQCTSEHHQAVARLGRGLTAVGWAADGVVEAVEHDEGWVVGVQWHPEEDATDVRLMAALVTAACNGLDRGI